MKRKVKFYACLILIIISILTVQTAYAHSGRTDSSGGHKDSKNKSGLGSYHYHHGLGPHLHSGGKCPYAPATPTPKPTAAPTTEVTSITIAGSRTIYKYR